MHLFDPSNILFSYGYAGILVIVFLESGLFFLLPGDSLLFTAGLLATALKFDVYTLTFFVFISAFLGGLAGYYLGTKLDYFYRFNFWRKIIKKEYLAEAHLFLAKHGLSALILSRFMPVVRTFLPIVAGMARMKYSDFVKYSLIGSFVWSSSFILGGYFFGRIFPELEHYLAYVIAIIVILSILPGIIHLLRAKYKTK